MLYINLVFSTYIERCIMDSITKSKISENQIRQLFKSAFGDKYILEGIVELKDGYFNTAYSITAKDGFKTILKVAPSKEIKLMRYEKNLMRAEVDTLNMIKEKTNVPVPKVYLYNSERDIIDNEYFFMEFINGIPLNKLKNSLSDENKEKIYKQIGVYTRQINNICGECFGYISQGDRQFENWFDAFTALVEDVLIDGQEASVELPVSYEKLSGIIGSGKDILNNIVKPSLIHKDLWAGNIFIDPISFEVTGIVDCERALWADPMMDFVFGYLEDKDGFNEGYGRNKAATDEEQCRKSLYRLYLYLILIIECKYRLYPKDDQEKWGRKMLEKELKNLL